MPANGSGLQVMAFKFCVALAEFGKLKLKSIFAGIAH